MSRERSRQTPPLNDRGPRSSKAANRVFSSLNEFTDNASPQEPLVITLGIVKELVTRSDEGEKDVVEKIVAATSQKTDAQSIFLQLEIAFYFDNIGDADRAVAIAQSAVDLAQGVDDINLQRKAHNTSGILYSRICDYEKACFHLERALAIALKLKNKCYEFAVLCNVVSTLQVMGLVNEAKRLSVKLSERPGGTPEMDYLHLQNAINGLRLSGYARDIETAGYFTKIAREKLECAADVSCNWKAYIDAYHSLSLLQQGKPEAAYSLIVEAIQQKTGFENPRISAILYCAFGLCALEVQDTEMVDEAIRVLVGLLEGSKNYALDHEDVLRTLVKLHEIGKGRRRQKAGLAYLRKLNDHIVNVKHKQFFRRMQFKTSGIIALQDKICRPSYLLPTSLANATLDERCETQCPPFLYASSNDQVQGKQLRFLDIFRRELEAPFRSEDFNAAEDWAVAADFSAGRQGGHCFEVGSLARLLALELGYSAERSMLIEMACRLHDIGKLAVDPELHRAVNDGRVDSYLSIIEHSCAGARLLSSSSDVVLQFATNIAKHHHEWWNGCGLPDGLAGEAIPIEARICAIADTYIASVYPSEPQLAWDKDAAIQQVVSMAGVQLDPNLIASFLLAVAVYNATNLDGENDGTPFQMNSLIIAKQQLLDAVKMTS